MSDGETVEEIEQHNVRIARRLVDYWRQKGALVEITNETTNGPQVKLGPNGLPRGYSGEDAIRVKQRA